MDGECTQPVVKCGAFEHSPLLILEEVIDGHPYVSESIRFPNNSLKSVSRPEPVETPDYYNLHSQPPYQTHRLCKSDGNSVVVEAMRFCTTPVRDFGLLGDHWKDSRLTMTAWMHKYLANRCYPQALGACLLTKNKKSKCGAGYQFYSNYASIVDKFTQEELVAMLNIFDQMAVSEGYVPGGYWVFPKYDKYPLAKIESKTFRTIQMAPLHSHMLMEKYLSTIEEAIKELNPHICTGLRPCDYAKKIGDLDLKSYSIGYDFTAMDRSIPAYMIVRIFQMFEPLIGKNLATMFSHDICFSPIIVPGQEFLFRSGGSPSGHRWTTCVNNLVTTWMHMATRSILVGGLKRGQVCLLPEDDFPIKVRIMGDDGLICADTLEHLTTYCTVFNFVVTQVWNEPGTGIKWDPFVAPPGVGSVFLDLFPAKVRGYTIPVQARTSRIMPKVVQHFDAERLETLVGVRDWLAPLIVMLADNGHLEKAPASLKWLVAQLQHEGVDLNNWAKTWEAVFVAPAVLWEDEVI